MLTETNFTALLMLHIHSSATNTLNCLPIDLNTAIRKRCQDLIQIVIKLICIQNRETIARILD